MLSLSETSDFLVNMYTKTLLKERLDDVCIAGKLPHAKKFLGRQSLLLSQLCTEKAL